jgi:hypothetical protein
MDSTAMGLRRGSQGLGDKAISLRLTEEDYAGRPTDLEEGVPLLHNYNKDSKMVPSFTKKLMDSDGPAHQVDHNNKMLCYDQDSLLSVTSLKNICTSAFCQGPVIKTFLYCSTLCIISAIIVFHFPKSSKLNTQDLQSFNQYLKIFIAFMLGIYLQQAFKRWWFAVTTFEKFLIAIRQMVFMLHTLGYHPEVRKIIEKYCVASGYILKEEVRFAEKVDKGDHGETEECLFWLVRKRMLTQDEVDHLDKKGKNTPLFGRTRAIWSWIAELISHPMVEEGLTVAPPLLLRCIVLCQYCIMEVENLKLNITMQTPFMYAQLLSILVHINNTLLALSCGMAIGSAANEIGRRNDQLTGTRATDLRDVSVMQQLYGACTTLGVQILIVAFVPMLYVAFLHISHMLCYPFGDECYHLPTETLIARLHSELLSMTENRHYANAKHKILVQRFGPQSHLEGPFRNPNRAVAHDIRRRAADAPDDDGDDDGHGGDGGGND